MAILKSEFLLNSKEFFNQGFGYVLEAYQVKIFVTILLVSIPAFFSLAHADNDRSAYIGFQFGSSEMDDGILDFEADLGLIRLGIMPTDNTAIEYRLGTGGSDDEVNSATFELENIYGLYGLYHYNFSDNASIYGVAGYSNVSFKASLGNSSNQGDENGFSYGIGAQVYGFNVEYMQYLDTTELEVGALAAGYNYKFE